ncbi:MAG: hypothetical protein ACR2OG_03735, partial [Gemmatimonadaceae bacterium]
MTASPQTVTSCRDTLMVTARVASVLSPRLRTKGLEKGALQNRRGAEAQTASVVSPGNVTGVTHV